MTNASTSTIDDGFEDNQATAQRAMAAIRVMTDALDAMKEVGSLTITPTAPARVFLIAYGWFASVVRSSQLIALAHENGLRHECAATSRLVLQHSLALQWLIEGGVDAVDAVEADGLRRAFDLEKELRDTGWPLPDGFTFRIGTRPAQSGRISEQFSNFKSMCVLYDGGDQQYVPYRVQSGYAHPSYAGAMAYIDTDTGELSAVALTDSFTFLVEAARCVILAGHAFSALLSDTSLAAAVSQAESALGIPFALWKRLP